MHTEKIILFFVLILLSINSVFAKPTFSISWENSFLTGRINVATELPKEIVDVTESVKGGQSLLVFCFNVNEYFSIGAGSGVNINKLNFLYDDIFEIIDDSLPMVYIPFFGELRGQFPVYGDIMYLYGSVKIGGSISPPEVKYYYTDYSFGSGLFLEPSAGISFNIKHFLLDLGVAYHLQKSSLIEDYYNDGYYNDGIVTSRYNEYPFDLHQFTIKLGLGVRFGKIK